MLREFSTFEPGGFQGGLPVDDTQTQNEEVYFVHSDHLGTPQKITSQNRQVVWAADYEPFGKATISTNTTGNDFNIRFPGQYADEESELHYNYFRDYDPSTGRYIESDPVGLIAGSNTYLYVQGNPLSFFDLLGLARDTITTRIEALAARGETQSLRTLLESGVLNPSQTTLLREALKRLATKADDFISQYCKGSVRREFPDQLKNHTLEDIIRLAKAGDRDAIKAKKLLTDLRFRK